MTKGVKMLKKLIDYLKGFRKKDNVIIEVECCEQAELKCPVTHNGYLKCAIGAEDVCPCMGLFEPFDGFCTKFGKKVTKKFTIPRKANRPSMLPGFKPKVYEED